MAGVGVPRAGRPMPRILQRLGVMTLRQGVLEQPAPRQAPTPEKRGWPRYDARATRAADRAPLGLEPGWHPL